jgi:hypothetical protein
MTGTSRSDESGNYCRIILDTLPMPVLIVDDHLRILDHNHAAKPLIGPDRTTFFHVRAGDVMRCLSSTLTPEGCGHSPYCQSCVIRNSVAAAWQGNAVHRSQSRLSQVTPEGAREIQLLVTTSAFETEGQRRVLVVLEDITEVVTLRGLLPICSFCKKIRDDDNYWQRLETFFASHLGVSFTHGLCPECLQKHYPEFVKPISQSNASNS